MRVIRSAIVGAQVWIDDAGTDDADHSRPLLGRHVAYLKDAGLLAFDEEKHLVLDLRRHGHAYDDFVQCLDDGRVGHFELHIDLRVLAFEEDRQARSASPVMRPSDRCVESGTLADSAVLRRGKCRSWVVLVCPAAEPHRRGLKWLVRRRAEATSLPSRSSADSSSKPPTWVLTYKDLRHGASASARDHLVAPDRIEVDAHLLDRLDAARFQQSFGALAVRAYA